MQPHQHLAVPFPSIRVDVGVAMRVGLCRRIDRCDACSKIQLLQRSGIVNEARRFVAALVVENKECLAVGRPRGEKCTRNVQKLCPFV